MIESGFMGNVIDNMLGEAKVSPHSLSENSELGALACFKNDVTLAMTLWRCKEINRDTDPAHAGHCAASRRRSAATSCSTSTLRTSHARRSVWP